MLISSFRNPVSRGIINLYSGTFLSGMGWSMVFPGIAIMPGFFGVSIGAAAQVVTLYGIGRFTAMPIAGQVIDRAGSRASLIAGTIFITAGAVIASLAPWFILILGASFIIGAGDGLWAMGREVSGVDLVKQNQRGRILSGFHGMHSGGFAVGPLLGGVLIEFTNLRVMFMAYALMAFLAMILASFSHNAVAAKDSKETTNAHDKAIDKNRLRRFLDLYFQIDPALRNTYLVFVFATAAAFMFRQTFQSILPLFAESEAGLSAIEIGVLFSFSGVLILIMIVPVGFILDKVGRKWATVPSTGLPAIAFIALPFTHSFEMMMVLVAFMGVANGLSLGSLAASTYDVVPESARGRLQAARRMVAEIGGVGAPLFGGLMMNMSGPGTPFLVYAPILILASLLLAFVAKETLIKNNG
ncbi:MAG: MFS transporter [SAR202 cluster bacterium]|nr:MFS transporter [SAR202 cluster bacterium]|tara:strand:- start:866 stop:2104 length:1239 start_codon:yes stop_codon:yes gene_type:complete